MAIDASSAATQRTAVVSHAHFTWSSIFAGVVVAAAIGLILSVFGAAVGLSATSAYRTDDVDPLPYIIGAGLWLIWIQLMAFGAGGYIAARMRPTDPTASDHEIDVRDGMHGAVVWGGGVLMAGAIALLGVSGAATAASSQGDTRSVVGSISRTVESTVENAASEEPREDAAAAQASADERKADVARKISVISAFISAASLLIGLVIAMFSAALGGRHRDQAVVVPYFNLRPTGLPRAVEKP